mmetsp:Transcript_75085/g.208815  ORF Transcript_75085/g.208815 Transcript_75085/m.208815 type:complete len:213 (-) Transcript_75085:84-722(-)
MERLRKIHGARDSRIARLALRRRARGQPGWPCAWPCPPCVGQRRRRQGAGMVRGTSANPRPDPLAPRRGGWLCGSGRWCARSPFGYQPRWAAPCGRAVDTPQRQQRRFSRRSRCPERHVRPRRRWLGRQRRGQQQWLGRWHASQGRGWPRWSGPAIVRNLGPLHVGRPCAVGAGGQAYVRRRAGRLGQHVQRQEEAPPVHFRLGGPIGFDTS